MLKLIEKVVDSFFLRLDFLLLFASQKLSLDLFSEHLLVLLDDGRLIVDGSVSRRDDASLSEVIQRPGVASLLHEKDLLLVPGVKVDRLDKGDNDSILSMLSGAVIAKMDAEGDG